MYGRYSLVDEETHLCTVIEMHIATEQRAGVTPGYGEPVIFADGTFIDGSTSEMSADGPMRPPFVVYCQGGIHWTQWQCVLVAVLPSLPPPKCDAGPSHS